MSDLVVATVNVNGVRAAVRRGMHGWLRDAAPDVVLLQEVRASTDVLLDAVGPGWHVVHDEGGVAGRAGVAIASRFPLQDTVIGLPAAPVESSGRWVEATAQTPRGPLRLISVYVHAATVGTSSMGVKLAFLDAIGRRIASCGVDALLGGDLNVASDQRDIKNWRGNRGKSGFLPVEQDHLRRWRDHGWVDVGREHAGDVDGPYTWWSWRGRAYDNDAGWRIDYLWASPTLAPSVRRVQVDAAARYDARWSDHAPVRVELVV